MFCGMVADIGTVVVVESTRQGKQLRIESRYEDLILGESIAVDGVCLTVTEITGSTFAAEVSPETLDKSIIRDYLVGTQVNLERAMLATDRIGGHIVTGHVDDRATVRAIERLAEFWRVTLAPQDRSPLSIVVPKGSIAVNGTSFTVNAVTTDCFEVMLIPHTLDATNLSNLSVDSQVNLEYDMLAKVVAKHVKEISVNV